MIIIKRFMAWLNISSCFLPNICCFYYPLLTWWNFSSKVKLSKRPVISISNRFCSPSLRADNSWVGTWTHRSPPSSAVAPLSRQLCSPGPDNRALDVLKRPLACWPRSRSASLACKSEQEWELFGGEEHRNFTAALQTVCRFHLFT